MTAPLIAIPAAGASSRMRGRDKLLELVDDIPLLRRQTRAALDTGHPVLVLMTAEGSRHDALDGLDVSIRDVPDAADGMSVTLGCAAQALQPRQPLVVLLPDVPGIKTGDIRTVLEAFEATGRTTPCRATDPNSRPGTPIALPYGDAMKLITLKGDDGGRSLFADRTIPVPFPDDRATRDLDTPEDWANWRRDH